MSKARARPTCTRRIAVIALVVLPHVSAVGMALASQGPGVSDGTAEPMTRATAAAMVLFPPVAVAVFALARLLGFGR